MKRYFKRLFLAFIGKDITCGERVPLGYHRLDFSKHGTQKLERGDGHQAAI